MRQHSRSLLIYILFGIVIAVFIINFGPGSKGCGGSIATTYAARIAGTTVPEQDFIHILQLLGYDREPADQGRARGTRQFLMELLIRRELLAQEAERLGLRVTEDEIDDRIAAGRIFVVGQSRNITMDYRFASIYKDGFDYDKFKQNFCTYFLHTTLPKFKEEQRRELLAEKARELIQASTKVGPDEVKRDYMESENQVKLKFVRFSGRRFEDEAELSASAVDAWLAQNKDKVREQYDARAFMYKQVPREEKLRVLFFETKKDASKEAIAKAEGRAHAALDRLKAGADFAKLARETSDDEKSKAKGGLVGWKRKGSPGFGPELDDKVFALKKGETSEVVKTDRGLWIARVEDVREGDLGFDAVAHELAEDMMRKERAQAKAKAEAEAVMARIKAGAKLDDLFPKEEGAKDDEASGKPAEEQAASPAAHQKTDKKAGAAAKADPNAPKLQETGLFPRRGNTLEDIGASRPAVDAIFGSLKKGEVGGPFEIAGGTPSYVIVEVVEHKVPDMAAFESKRDEITRRVAASKWGGVLNDLAHRRCVEAREGGKITVNPEMLSSSGEETSAYQPCTGFGMR
jgi:peptidyl-prolyl cis-trans isomerase D